MGSDYAMETRNFRPRPNIIEWDGDTLIVQKDYPVSGYATVWQAPIDLENSTEVTLFEAAFGRIPEKPAPVIPTQQRVIDILRNQYDWHNSFAVHEIMQVIYDVERNGVV